MSKNEYVNALVKLISLDSFTDEQISKILFAKLTINEIKLIHSAIANKMNRIHNAFKV